MNAYINVSFKKLVKKCIYENIGSKISDIKISECPLHYLKI